MISLAALLASSPSLVAALPAPGRTCVVSAAGAADLARSSAVLDAVRAEVERAIGEPAIPTPAIELEAIQLALGCVGEAPACASALARQLGADTLVVVRLDATAEGSEVALTRIDGASGARVATERAREAPAIPLATAAARAAAALFAPAPPEEARVIAAPAGPAATPSVYPLATAGAGVLALGIGAVLGAVSASGERAYAEHAIASRADVDDALDTLDGARGQATAANVLFVVGGALVAGGAAWLAVELVSP